MMIRKHLVKYLEFGLDELLYYSGAMRLRLSQKLAGNHIGVMIYEISKIMNHETILLDYIFNIIKARKYGNISLN